jgi:hypothetical protein
VSPADILRAARERIATPERWNQGWFAADAAGREVSSVSPIACSWCALGAVYATSGGARGADVEALLIAALPAECSAGDVGYFNDLPATTHADVLALFDRAIAAAEAGQ